MTDNKDNQPADELEPIPAEQAREILRSAIEEKLGKHWNDEESGWMVVSRHDYMARLTRGNKNIDFYVDLLGNLTVEEKEISGGQENGRFYAWLILGGSIIAALVLARLAGYL